MLIILLAILAVLGFIWYKFDEWNEFAFTACVITAGLLVVSLISLPISYYSGMAEIERYHALKESYENSRNQEVSEYERATIAQKVAEYNADIASVRYWNDTIFDIFIPDELAELDYLE